MSKPDKSKLTPMMKQYFDIKEEYPDGVLFFRMGDFYEMFLEDAEKAAGPLEVTLTKRNGMSMCGVPYHAKDNYLPKLLKAGFKIIICDQLEDPKLAKGIVKRGVTEIITPGTITDSMFISSNTNYLTTFMFDGNNLAVASTDISTGSFIAQQEKYKDLVSSLRDEIARIKPKEVIIKDSYRNNNEVKKALDTLDSNISITYYNDVYYDTEVTYKIVTNQFKVTNLKGYGIEDKKLIISVTGVLIRYLRQTQLRDISHIDSLQIILPSEYMKINDASINHLELLESKDSKDNKTSLFNNINDTVTNMGSRLLQQSIARPMTDENQIKARLDKVDIFYEDRELMQEIRSILKEMSDIDRLVARLSLTKITPREIISLKSSIKKVMEMKQVLEEVSIFDPILEEVTDFSGFIKLIEKTLLENCTNDLESGEVINPKHNKELADYLEIRKNGKKLILKLEEEERAKTGIPTLKISFNNVIGYFVQVTKIQSKSMPDYYHKRQSLKSGERYSFEKLSEMEIKIKSAQDKISQMQRTLYENLVKKLKTYISVIKDASSVVARIDLISSFAYTSFKNKYVKPNINSSKELKIVGGRHPVVEKMVDEYKFVSNDLTLNDKDSKLLIITGPNMSGKSTYLRQNALIVIMAQMGSYVPAEEAKIGIVDSIFTRIGASDNLAKGESTFLVEMSETANILNNMTDRSLIIMDEIGRGTSTYDGLSIAWSIIEYLTDKSISSGKTLFATHYHELTSLAQEKGIRNFQVVVREWEDDIVFLHKVEEGASSKSYGIQVARLAGVPKYVIDRAKELLSDLEEQSVENQKKMLKQERLEHPVVNETGQMSLFQISTKMDPIRREIIKTDISKLTPNKLLSWAKKLKKMSEDDK